MRKESGFSVVELLIVIAIIATLSLAGVAGWYSFMPSYRLRTAIDELQATMQMARLRAIKENGVTTVRFTGTDTYQAFVDADEDGTFNAGAGDTVFLTRTLPPTVFQHAVTGVGYAQFNSRGLPEAGAMSFQLRNGKGQYLGISMTVAGSFSVQTSGTGDAGTWVDQYD